MRSKVAGIVFIVGSVYYILAEAISAAFFNASLFNTYVFHAISELGIPNGNSPLFFACLNGNETVVKYLVEQGANINIEDRSGETPLCIAFSSGNEAVVKYLVEHGANINKAKKI